MYAGGVPRQRSRAGSCEEQVDSAVDILRIRFRGSSIDVAPTLGLCVLSWRIGTRELLSLPAPLPEFAAAAKTGGLPLLYPWANRLRSDRYTWEGCTVDLASVPDLKRDANRLPIHGTLLRFGAWKVVAAHVSRAQATCVAHLDWHRDVPGFPAFPFRHELIVAYQLRARSLRASVWVVADSGPVPVAFGWHPYLLGLAPGRARSECVVSLPSREPIGLDERMLPRRASGSLVAAPALPGESRPLGGRSFDDLFRVHAHAHAGVGDVRLSLEGGYRFLQVYAPADSDFVCVEPMVAPGAALSDGADLAVSAPHRPFEASFLLEFLG